jgi:hypothetical protein
MKKVESKELTTLKFIHKGREVIQDGGTAKTPTKK